ncbi:hypothetical protein [Sebaldella termitidis]|uniref:hypothetical protein n=1 Tax=Sebaldella termitidis TaxID=826 RepID=UPI003EC012FD
MALVVQPCSNSVAFSHYKDTIQKFNNLDSLEKYLKKEDFKKLIEIFPSKKVRIWGVTPSSKKKWEKLSVGDITLFYRTKRIFSKATMVLKLHNPELAEFLWDRDKTGVTWEYIYFLDEVEEIDLGIEDFNRIMEYESNYIIQGFNVYTNEKGQKLLDFLNLKSDIYEPDINKETYKTVIDNDTEIQKKVEEFFLRESLDIERTLSTRVEQAYLRKKLFKNKRESRCCICGKKYLVSFMVAAHIKKRSLCSKDEKLDAENIVAPMCKFGCDEMFERGYIFVDDGFIDIKHDGDEPEDFINHLRSLKGRKCLNYNEDNKKYYDFHRKFFKK